MKQFSSRWSLLSGAIAALVATGCAAPSAAPSAPSASTAATAGALAPIPGVSRPGFDPKPILSSPISGDDQKEIVVISVTLAPGAVSPHHTHPGDCVGAVVEGQVEVRAVGKEPRVVPAGTAFANPRGTVHQFVNSTDKPARMVTTLVVDKGKPRTVIQNELQ